jgi:hypothetical protein
LGGLLQLLILGNLVSPKGSVSLFWGALMLSFGYASRSLRRLAAFIKKKCSQNSPSGPFIQKGHYLLNLLKTRQCLKKATLALAKYAVKGRTFLFVGTKKPASNLISRAALFSQKSFFVNTRLLYG